MSRLKHFHKSNVQKRVRTSDPKRVRTSEPKRVRTSEPKRVSFEVKKTVPPKNTTESVQLRSCMKAVPDLQLKDSKLVKCVQFHEHDMENAAEVTDRANYLSTWSTENYRSCKKVRYFRYFILDYCVLFNKLLKRSIPTM